MKKDKLYNNTYEDFILQHIVRPYQSMFSSMDGRYEKLVFKRTQSKTSFNYWDLLEMIYNERGWIKLVVDRVSKIYNEIDFSFFPQYDAIAAELKELLIEAGVKENERYGRYE